MNRVINKDNFSMLVSDTLDTLGYNEIIVKYRQAAWKINATKLEQTLNPHEDFSCIYAGSKGEGVTAFWESDMDVMFVHNDVICIEGAWKSGITGRSVTVLELDRETTAPGYTRLRLSRLASLNSNIPPARPGHLGGNVGNISNLTSKVNHQGRHVSNTNNQSSRFNLSAGHVGNTSRFGGGHIGRSASSVMICNSLVSTETGSKYVSSDVFFSYITANRPRTGPLPRQGPSAPSKALGISQDVVYAFRCYCPNILTAWTTRHRSNDWPPQHTIKKISTLEAQIVPVGLRSSKSQFLEWRICFTSAEIELIHSFNDSQTKVYIMLKWLAKSVLMHVCDAITSYVMKNIIFWVSERTHSRLFRNDFLIDRLVQCLLILSRFIERNFVPNYMIPKRNLIFDKIDKRQRIQLLAILRELTDDGGSMLLRCSNLRRGLVKMYKTPEVAKAEQEEIAGRERQLLAQSDSLRQHLLQPKMTMAGGVLHPHSVKQGPVFTALGKTTRETDEPQDEPQEDATDSPEDQLVVHELLRLGKDVGTQQWIRLREQTKKDN